MLTLRREKTWDWDVNNKKTVQNPQYRENQRWLSGKFASFDYSNDARFETFKSYPKNKQLYRKHRDFAKDYDRQMKFYKSRQRCYCVEWNRQITYTRDRFSKLISGTFDTSLARSKTLQYSYNKWAPKREVSNNNDDSHVVENTDNGPEKEDDLDIAPRDQMELRSPIRLHSLRSISVDNINLATDIEGRASHSRHHRDDVSGRASVQEIRPMRGRFSQRR